MPPRARDARGRYCSFDRDRLRAVIANAVHENRGVQVADITGAYLHATRAPTVPANINELVNAEYNDLLRQGIIGPPVPHHPIDTSAHVEGATSSSSTGPLPTYPTISATPSTGSQPAWKARAVATGNYVIDTGASYDVPSAPPAPIYIPVPVPIIVPPPPPVVQHNWQQAHIQEPNPHAINNIAIARARKGWRKLLTQLDRCLKLILLSNALSERSRQLRNSLRDASVQTDVEETITIDYSDSLNRCNDLVRALLKILQALSRLIRSLVRGAGQAGRTYSDASGFIQLVGLIVPALFYYLYGNTDEGGPPLLGGKRK